MELDADRCYRAIEARDPRFDGRFFTAVRTTRVYCRPVCPARTPRRENVRFFACAAAAAEAGFRPCLRCRPEASPGTWASLDTSSTVSRALRLIAQGALDRKSVEALAHDLGLGGRQLRRLFHEHLGVTPVAVAATQRVHFAKKLLDDTRLPIAAVATAAGFGSSRRFNHAFFAAYAMPPTALRRRRGSHAGNGVGDRGDDSRLTLRLALRPPFDFASVLAFLRPRALPGVETVDGDGVYRRTFAAAAPGAGDGAAGIVEVRATGSAELALTLPAGAAAALVDLARRARRLFDLDADPAVIAGHLGGCPVLAPLVRACPGRRVPGAWDPFEVAVRAVLGQQVSVAGATTIAGRIIAAYGEPLAAAGAEGLTHLFPTPERLAKAPLETAGMPRARAETIRTLATRVAAGEPVLEPGPDLDTTIARLMELPGFGPWTAHYLAMRALGEPDAFPSGDLGLRRALAHDGRDATAAEIEAKSQDWRPWRAYAALHLWSSLAAAGAVKPELKRRVR